MINDQYQRDGSDELLALDVTYKRKQRWLGIKVPYHERWVRLISSFAWIF